MGRDYYRYEDSFFFDFLLPTLVVVILVGGILTGMAHIFEGVDHDACHEKGDLANVQVTYRKWSGCYANDNGLWVPFDTWRYNKNKGYTRTAK